MGSEKACYHRRIESLEEGCGGLELGSHSVGLLVDGLGCNSLVMRVFLSLLPCDPKPRSGPELRNNIISSMCPGCESTAVTD